MKIKYKFLRTKALFQIFLVVTVSLFIAISLNSKDVEAGCCRDYGNGQTCVDAQSDSDCVSYGMASCDSDSGCGKMGCCVVGEQCSENTAEYTCEAGSGEWNSGLCSEGNNKAVCVRGCCVVGDSAFLSTSTECEELYNGNYNEDINIADSCSALVSGSENGCCVEGDVYTYSLREECGGEFYGGNVCSVVSGYSEAGYTSHNKAECGPAGTAKAEDVYWYDSAGNLEGVKEDCEPDNLNGPGTICGDYDSDGNYICEGLDCAETWDNPVVSTDGGFRRNGESWCEYQAAVGPGLDLPGTSHYMHRCDRGREIVEPCASDRSTICVQEIVDFGDAKISSASCVANTADNCVACKDGKDCCKNPALNCIWSGDGDECFPLVSLTSGGKVEAATGDDKDKKSICKKGSFVARSAWHKACHEPNWECKKGCSPNNGIFGDKFLKSANVYCRLWGDCGSTWNLAHVYYDEGMNRKCNTAKSSDVEGKCDNELSDKKNPFENLLSAGAGLSFNITLEDLLANTSEDNLVDLSTTDLIGAINFALANNFKAGGAYSVGSATRGGWIFGLTVLFILIAPVLLLVELIYAIVTWKRFTVSLGKFFGCNKESLVKTKMTCSAWLPPEGGNDCWRCSAKIQDGGVLPNEDFTGEDGYSPYVCSPELCSSLGRACKYEGEEPSGPRCVKTDVTDSVPPIINVDYANTKYYCNQDSPGGSDGCVENTQSGITVSNDGGLEKGFEIKGLLVDLYERAVKDESQMNISITTNEDAICMYSTNDEGGDANYEDMTNEFVAEGMEGGHSMIHTLTLGGSLVLGGEHTLYVRCEDWNSVSNSAGYIIKYKVAEQPDFSPPIIDSVDPESGSFLKYGENMTGIILKVNEPIISEGESETDSTGAGCKWSKNANIPYSAMSNDTLMICDEESMECFGSLDGFVGGENTFYFRCRDNSGNSNEQDYSYSLKLSEGELSIGDVTCEYILPDGVGSSDCANVYARNFTLVANTEGGMDGTATCSYTGVGGGKFFETGGSVHKQKFGGDGTIAKGFAPGSYGFTLHCADESGNLAEKQASVNIKVDNSDPKVERFYIENRILNVITDEEARCCHTHSKDFRYGECEAMDAAASLNHQTAVDSSYYKIGCIDRFGNYMTPINIYI